MVHVAPKSSCESLLSLSHVYHFHINHNLDKNDQENHIQTRYSLAPATATQGVMPSQNCNVLNCLISKWLQIRLYFLQGKTYRVQMYILSVFAIYIAVLKKMNTNQKWEVQEWLHVVSSWLCIQCLEIVNVQ